MNFGFYIVGIFFLASFAFAEEAKQHHASSAPKIWADPRGPAELIVCSQNLENYGSLTNMRTRNARTTPEQITEKEMALVKRFISAKCDVVAVQEVLGRTEQEAKEALENLAVLLRKKSNRIFDTVTGPSSDPMIRNGFLIAKERAEISNVTSYWRVELPKFVKKQKPRVFARGPLEVQLEVQGKEGSAPKSVNLINLHFKSKAGGSGDPSGLQWEGLRVEMAEGLRRIVENRHAASFASGETLLLVMGDRNSNFDSASAKVLEGTISIADFQNEAPCRISKIGAPICKTGTYSPQRLFSVLRLDPQVKQLRGTFRYKKEDSWLDEILMPAESLPAAEISPGDYASGVVYQPMEASDHAMVWVELNW